MQKTERDLALERQTRQLLSEAGLTRITVGRIVTTNVNVTPQVLTVTVDGVDRQCSRLTTYSPLAGEMVAVALTGGTSLVLGRVV